MRVKKALNEFGTLSATDPDGIIPIMLQNGWDLINVAFTNIAKSSWSNSTGFFLPKPGKDDYFNPANLIELLPRVSSSTEMDGAHYSLTHGSGFENPLQTK